MSKKKSKNKRPVSESSESSESEEIKRLREEGKRLRMEVDILKKAKTFIAESK